MFLTLFFTRNISRMYVGLVKQFIGMTDDLLLLLFFFCNAKIKYLLRFSLPYLVSKQINHSLKFHSMLIKLLLGANILYLILYTDFYGIHLFSFSSNFNMNVCIFVAVDGIYRFWCNI